MHRYLLRRLSHAVVVLLAAFTVTFVLLYLLPSDPVAIMLARGAGEGAPLTATPDQVAALTAKYGLDKPAPLQYFQLLLGYLQGDLGTSILTGQPVLDTILGVLPNTFRLSMAALTFAIVLGLGLGALSAYTRTPLLRGILLILPAFGAAAPSFWIALVLLQVFAFRLGIFPVLGFDQPLSIVLPAISLAIPTAASIAQVFARSALETSGAEFVDVAYAKGIGRPAVFYRHIARNAILPTVTLIGLSVGGLLGGAVVIETVFSIDGVGKLTQSAVETQDIPLVQGIVCLLAVIFVSCNLVIDLLYPLLDPRLTDLLNGKVPNG